MSDHPKDMHARIPADATAARVMQRGVSYVAERAEAAGVCSDLPLPIRASGFQCNEDLTGRAWGRMVVLGLARDRRERWVCRCVCGHYVYRKARTIKKADPDEACHACQHVDQLKRKSTWIATGERI